MNLKPPVSHKANGKIQKKADLYNLSGNLNAVLSTSEADGVSMWDEMLKSIVSLQTLLTNETEITEDLERAWLHLNRGLTGDCVTILTAENPASSLKIRTELYRDSRLLMSDWSQLKVVRNPDNWRSQSEKMCQRLDRIAKFCRILAE